MKIAVTAASGQLGAAVVAALVERLGTAQVVALARRADKAAGLGVEVRPGSYDDPEALAHSLAGVDTVLLVSGMDAPERRVQQHRNVIAAAAGAGVQRIVYTSIQGPPEGTAFSPIVASNRQTEADVRASGLAWAIGRNGIYIEPDVEYLPQYVAAGEVANCAGEGVCGYTTRDELAAAYARLLTEPELGGSTYNLHGEPLSQTALSRFLSVLAGCPLRFRDMSVEDYKAWRIAELGEFMGTVVAGIYQGIRDGHYGEPSHFEAAAGRAHVGWNDYFAQRAGTTAPQSCP